MFLFFSMLKNPPDSLKFYEIFKTPKICKANFSVFWHTGKFFEFPVF